MAFRDRALGLVEQLVLEDHHRIGIGDRGEQHALGLARGRRLDDLEPRHMGEPGLQALAVLRGGAGSRPRRQSEDDRNGNGPAKHVTQLRRLIDDLLRREHREIRKLELVNWPHAVQRRADRDARAAELRNRRVHDALVAEACERDRR